MSCCSGHNIPKIDDLDVEALSSSLNVDHQLLRHTFSHLPLGGLLKAVMKINNSTGGVVLLANAGLHFGQDPGRITNEDLYLGLLFNVSVLLERMAVSHEDNVAIFQETTSQHFHSATGGERGQLSG